MGKTNHFDQTNYAPTENNDFLDFIMHQKIDMGSFVLRLALGGLMLFHGLNKVIFGTEQIEGILVSAGMPAFFSFGVFIGEVLAPILLIIGWKTRIAAFLMAVDMLIATLLVHAGSFMELNQLGGWMLELNALYFFGAIALMFLGSGRVSISKGQGAFD